MSKISVIIAHEYRTRVRNKWFIIGTLLGPLLLSLFIVIPIVATFLAGDGTEGKVAVLDRTGVLAPALIAKDTSLYVSAGSQTVSQLNKAVQEEKIQAWIDIPASTMDSGSVTLFSRGGSGIAFEERIESDIEPLVVNERLRRNGTNPDVIKLVEQGVRLQALKVTDKGVEQDASKASAAMGYGAGFVIYMLIFMYGGLVMRGVVEEKANRIVEVLASSARPYDIMMGKVVGIGLVGLTQMIAWIVLGLGVTALLGTLFASNVDPATTAASIESLQSMQGSMPQSQAPMMIGSVALPSISVWSILLFVFYFLSGYFLYSTLYAAVGSAVDQEADAGQLTLPITMPVILTMLLIGNVIASPNGTFAVVASLIPLFTPILMTVRVAATDVPLWQILLSMVLMLGSFVGAVWLAARIYRIGILSYGKKPTFKDLASWITMKI